MQDLGFKVSVVFRGLGLLLRLSKGLGFGTRGLGCSA